MCVRDTRIWLIMGGSKRQPEEPILVDCSRRERERETESNRFPLTHEIDNTVGDTQGAGGLDATAQLDDLGPQLAVGGPGVGVLAVLLHLEAGKVLLGEVDEAGADVAPDEVGAAGVGALDGDLDLQAAGAEAQVHDGLAAARLAVGGGGGAGGGPGEVARQAAGAGLAADAGLVLLDLVVARDAEVDLALADKGGDVGGGEEDEGDGEVLDEGYIEAVLAAELDVGALEEVEGGLLEAALWRRGGKSGRARQYSGLLFLFCSLSSLSEVTV